jgi:iron complex outermembrane receptor protein
MNYFGEQYVINTATQQFTVPEYTTFDATVFYDRPAYRIGLKVDNLTDEVYWNAWGAPQPPRRFIGNVTYKF